MTTSSEDVLLQMGGVRYKKGDGTLYVMNERIAWMVENRDKVAVSHKYQDIKSKLTALHPHPILTKKFFVSYSNENSAKNLTGREAKGAAAGGTA